MATPRKKDSQRFRIYTSQRSGFEFGFQPITERPNAYWREAGKPVQDVNIQVSPDEFDQPPPSTEPLGGQGDISGSARANSDFSVDSNVYITPPPSIPVVYYVSSSQSIPWNTKPVVYVGGSNSNITMASNPQIVPGRHNLIVAFQCIGSNIILNSGNGLTFDFNRTPFINMTSGGIITAIYNQTDSTWHITSFNPDSGGF